MFTFAEELNNHKCSCILEDGHLWVHDEINNKISRIGQYYIAEYPYSHPSVHPYFRDGRNEYIVHGFKAVLIEPPYYRHKLSGRHHAAVFDPNAPVGEQWRDVDFNIQH